ncbi:MAG TPA: C45 family autoproteolytic acyltransferase/hydrolase, partial [Isosphaeraceae bacterium]
MNPIIRPSLLTLGLLLSGPWAALAARPEPPADAPTDPAAVERYGPPYRYPKAGWIVLHIEGEPYERGYQHGRLLAPEIADYVKTLAGRRSARDPAVAWREVRTMVNALFLRGYDKEYLEEMKGIADGAAAAGARFKGRLLDLVDVAAINSDIEIEFLDSALEATATGLEPRVFKEPEEPRPHAPHEEHCSAFAATGPATADGHIVFGHITMFNLAFCRFFNVWLDVKPARGHRVFMQSYPGGIQSGMDYYYNDAGLLVTETTLAQTKFDINGDALASRIRKTLQYADSIDEAVAILGHANNGLYTNEWLLGDIKTDEIAMYELGTHKTRLWRSGKGDWFGGTEGFYWGCNNAKDLDVRLETIASLKGKPEPTVWVPSDRDIKWVELYRKHKGKLGEPFGFEAYSTPPLAAFASLDAKFTTASMVKDLKTHALFGPPLGRTWDPTPWDRNRVPNIRPLVSNDWTVLTAEPPPMREKGTKAAVDLEGKTSFEEASNPEGDRPPAWHGTILAKSDADTWLAAAFAEYERIFALEHAYKMKEKDKDGKLSKAEEEQLALTRYRHEADRWLATLQLGHDVALDKTRADLMTRGWYAIAGAKGIDVLAALRSTMGDKPFVACMDGFGRDHAGKPVTTAEFLAAAEKAHGKPLGNDVRDLITKTAEPKTPSWSVDAFNVELDRTLIVTGTRKDVAAQREAAERLQRQIA